MVESKARGGERAQRTFSTLATFEDEQHSSRTKDEGLKTSLIAYQKKAISCPDIGQKFDNLAVSVLRMGINGDFI